MKKEKKDPHRVVLSPERIDLLRCAIKRIISRPCTPKKYSWAIRMACAICDLELVEEVRKCKIVEIPILQMIIPYQSCGIPQSPALNDNKVFFVSSETLKKTNRFCNDGLM